MEEWGRGGVGGGQGEGARGLSREQTKSNGDAKYKFVLCTVGTQYATN